MALVHNNVKHPTPLTVGYLAGDEERNIDISPAWEQSLISSGVLSVLDSASPPPPVEPLANTPRELFVASAQPAGLTRGDVWLDRTAGAFREAQADGSVSLVLGSGSLRATGSAALDTPALQALIDAGGGLISTTVAIPAFRTNAPIVPKKNSALVGVSRGGALIKLADAANCTVIETANFATLLNSGNSATDGSGGTSQFLLRNLTIDGNRANNAGGNGLSLYGYDYDVENVTVRNCAVEGVRTQFGAGAAQTSTMDSLESRYRGLKIHDNGRHGWWHQGPQDSQATDVVIWSNNQSGAAAGLGFWAENDNVTNGSGLGRFTANGLQMKDLHVWGSTHTWGVVIDTSASLSNHHSEGAAVVGASTGQMLVRGSLRLKGGQNYYIASQASKVGKGIQLGDDGATTGVPTTAAFACFLSDIDTESVGFKGISRATAAVDVVNMGTSRVRIHAPMAATTTGMTVAAGSNGQAANALTAGTLNLQAAVPAALDAAGQVVVLRSGVIVAVITYTGKAGTTLTGCTSTSAATVATGDDVRSYNQALWGTPDNASDVEVFPGGSGMMPAVQRATGYRRLVSLGLPPTAVVNANAGVGATVAVEGTDTAGRITLTTGTGPSAGGQVTFTYSSARARRATVILLAQNDAAEIVPVSVNASGSGGWILRRGAAALVASTTYIWDYVVVE